MDPWFREIFEGLDGNNRLRWPNNKYFGNYMKYLYQQYARNVITNLTTHQRTRLYEYLKLIVWELNENNDDPDYVYDENDIKNAVNWGIKRYNSTGDNVDRLYKRNYLLSCVRQIGGPPDDNIAKDTEDNWLASLPMWLQMQASIDRYHIWVEDNGDTIPEDMELPVIKNLSVIPICSHLRKFVRIDADVLYRMMCDTKLIPLDDRGVQVTVGHVCQNKAHYFNEIFNMQEINKVLKANKEFHCQVLCDGVSASILYKVKKTVLEQLEKDDLVQKQYHDGGFMYVLGIDPGLKTWNATVRRHIQSGKEVCICIFSIGT